MANCDSTDGFTRCVACSGSCSWVRGRNRCVRVLFIWEAGGRPAERAIQTLRLPGAPHVTRPRALTSRAPVAGGSRSQKKRQTTHPPPSPHSTISTTRPPRHGPVPLSLWANNSAVPRATQRSTQPTPRHRVSFSVVDAPFFGSLLRRRYVAADPNAIYWMPRGHGRTISSRIR
ncbi:hypothetical protein BZL39_G05010 [Zygosaccharomyces parabailii]|nr:hypothetical protein BZL39_G05010 [Zygosaccharomyces parabailii]